MHQKKFDGTLVEKHWYRQKRQGKYSSANVKVRHTVLTKKKTRQVSVFCIFTALIKKVVSNESETSYQSKC